MFQHFTAKHPFFTISTSRHERLVARAELTGGGESAIRKADNTQSKREGEDFRQTRRNARGEPGKTKVKKNFQGPGSVRNSNRNFNANTERLPGPNRRFEKDESRIFPDAEQSQRGQKSEFAQRMFDERSEGRELRPYSPENKRPFQKRAGNSRSSNSRPRQDNAYDEERRNSGRPYEKKDSQSSNQRKEGNIDQKFRKDRSSGYTNITSDKQSSLSWDGKTPSSENERKWSGLPQNRTEYPQSRTGYPQKRREYSPNRSPTNRWPPKGNERQGQKNHYKGGNHSEGNYTSHKSFQNSQKLQTGDRSDFTRPNYQRDNSKGDRFQNKDQDFRANRDPESRRNFEEKNLNPWRQELSPNQKQKGVSLAQTPQTQFQSPNQRSQQNSDQSVSGPGPLRSQNFGDNIPASNDALREQRESTVEEKNAEVPTQKPIQVAAPIMREASGSTATFFSQSSLIECGLNETILQALNSLGVQKPSHIQAAAFKALLREEAKHAVIADHSGSGKTLAYLIPILQSLKESEMKDGKRNSSQGSPFAVIILPTTELCNQVFNIAKALLAGGVRFSLDRATGGYRKITQRDRLREGVDVLIATPGRLNEFLKDGELKLEKCNFVVLDEVDVLFSDTSLFREEIEPLKTSAPESTNFILVTASLPEPIWMDLQIQFPGVKSILGPGLHRPAPGSTEQLIDCSGGDEINEDTGFDQKFAGLINVLLSNSVDRTLIFCNKLQNCRKVENAINRAKVLEHLQVLPYHNAINISIREQNLREFLQPNTEFKRQPMVLISTDRASRGIDTFNVGHVVLFDFPRDPSEYVRRAGRTARGAGGQGVVSMLVLGRQIQLAKQILDRNEKGAPLHKIPVASL